MARMTIRVRSVILQLIREIRYFIRRSKLILSAPATNQAMHLVKTIVWCEILAITFVIAVAPAVLILLSRKAGALAIVLSLALLALETVIYLVYDDAQTNLLQVSKLSTRKQLLKLIDQHFQLSQLRKKCKLRPKTM